MLKPLLMMIASTSALTALALPQGAFEGSGNFSASDGMNQEFISTLKINGDLVSATYELCGDADEVITATVREQKNGFFEVTIVDGKGIVMPGRGYCSTSICQFHVSSDSTSVHETWVIQENQILRYGFRQSGQSHNQSTHWNDVLKRVE